MNLRISILSLMILASVASAQATRPADFVQQLQQNLPQKVVYFGTSLTQYGPWVKQFSDALDKQFPKLCTYHNGGGSGQNSRWGLANVQKNVIDEKPDVVFIEFTVNDSVARFNMSVEESKANTEKIISAIRTAVPTCEIILQIMNPVVGYKPGDTSYRLDQGKYEQMYHDLGKEMTFTVIDHHASFQAALDAEGEQGYKDKYAKDGVHPNGPACAKFVTPEILSAIGLKEGVAK